MAEETETAGSPGLAQCEITGNWVPEDELITIHGHRVCAEGKQILLERLKSGEALPGELERPSVMRRFGAMIVDGLVLGVASGIVMVMFIGKMFVNFAAGVAPGTASGLVLRAALGGILVSLLSFAYFTAMHAHGGQTLGKMAAKIRVVKEDGSPIDLKIAALRILYYNGYNIISPFMTLVGLAFVGQMIAVAGGLYVLGSTITALVDTAEQRAIHDRLAGTRVIVVA